MSWVHRSSQERSETPSSQPWERIYHSNKGKGVWASNDDQLWLWGKPMEERIILVRFFKQTQHNSLSLWWWVSLLFLVQGRNTFAEGNLCPILGRKGKGRELTSGDSQLPATLNNPHAKVADLGVAYWDPLQKSFQYILYPYKPKFNL